MRTRVRADENRKWLTFAAVRLRDLLPNAAPTDVSVFESSRVLRASGFAGLDLSLRSQEGDPSLAAFRGRSMIDVPRCERLWARASWNS